jgi:MmgE/PrpD N-terminal domain
MTATGALARFTSGLSLDDVPQPVVRAVKRLLLDHLGCTLGGSRTPLARAAGAATADGGRGATVLGTRQRAAPGPAAFANAMAANALDYDDTAATGHPGSTLIPPWLSPRRRAARARSSWRPSLRATRSARASWRGCNRAGSVASRSTGVAPCRRLERWPRRLACCGWTSRRRSAPSVSPAPWRRSPTRRSSAGMRTSSPGSRTTSRGPRRAECGPRGSPPAASGPRGRSSTASAASGA